MSGKRRKIILSRKGFDTSTGGIPSWIYQGKTYSIPIPEAGSGMFYQDLKFDTQNSYLDVMRDLGVKCYSEAHLDPDIKQGILKDRTKSWKPAFGQHGAALSHLLQSQYAVQKGDLFLFFGWFKEIEKHKGKFQYVKDVPDIHLIYGYLEIGEIIEVPSTNYPDYLASHPHLVFEEDYNRGNNCIFIAAEKSSWFENAAGAGNFLHHPELMLSYLKGKPYKRSLWALPAGFFKKGKCLLSYHENREGQTISGLKGKKLLQSVARGQEFIVPINSGMLQWVQSLQTFIDRETT